jgi:anti-sigma factor RsiW
MNTQQIEEQIWSYIDGTATAEEIAFVERMLSSDEVWRSTYNDLKAFNQLLQADLQLEQPPLRFSKNVMEQLEGLQPAPATRNAVNKSIIRAIAAFFMIIIVGFLIYGCTLIDWSVSTSSNSTLQYQLPAFDYSTLLNSTWINMLLMIAVVIGLMLMDGYLRRKPKAV